jgi:hypothetical protein
MRKIDYILGLPIEPNSVTSEFLDFLHSDKKKVLLSTGAFFFDGPDYKGAKVGFDMLMENNFRIYSNNNKLYIPPPVKNSITHFNLNNRSFETQNLSQMGELIISEMEEMIENSNIGEDVEVGYMCAGSPRLYDTVCYTLMQQNPDIKIIDTKSSAELIYEKIGSDKPLNVVHSDNLEFLEGHINTFGCIGNFYRSIDVSTLIQRVRPFENIYQYKFGYEEDQMVRKIHKEQFFYEIQSNPNFFDTSTIAIY